MSQVQASRASYSVSALSSQFTELKLTGSQCSSSQVHSFNVFVLSKWSTYPSSLSEPTHVGRSPPMLSLGGPATSVRLHKIWKDVSCSPWQMLLDHHVDTMLLHDLLSEVSLDAYVDQENNPSADSKRLTTKVVDEPKRDNSRSGRLLQLVAKSAHTSRPIWRRHSARCTKCSTHRGESPPYQTTL